ncbi:MAG TPA: GNAT family N-acetyltransferase [Tepidisphaeraceae bacterium]|nr:GNAT family N-acetyltransferase [Tepidisphaeraceae bacterium]
MSPEPFDLRRFDDPVEFAALTRPFLLRHEAEHCFFIGHIPTLPTPTDVLLLAVTDAGGATVAVALMTPGRHILMTRAPAGAVRAVARHLDAHGIAPPGIQAPRDVVDEFVRSWRTLTGAVARSPVSMGIHQATRIFPPARPAPGKIRTGESADLELLERWAAAFAQEIGEPQLADPAITRRRIMKGQLMIWEDGGQAVAMAGSAGETPNGIRVNAVYTPPPFRNRGYASTLVATLSQQLLDAGRRFCFLYTDLANPTSNKIYRAIGYEPIAQSTRIEFDHPNERR